MARTYATLAADGLSANLKFTPDEQEFKCAMAPDLFSPIPNKWGEQGWTTLRLDRAEADEVEAALVMAHRHALPRPGRGRARPRSGSDASGRKA